MGICRFTSKKELPLTDDRAGDATSLGSMLCSKSFVSTDKSFMKFLSPLISANFACNVLTDLQKLLRMNIPSPNSKITSSCSNAKKKASSKLFVQDGCRVSLSINVSIGIDFDPK